MSDEIKLRPARSAELPSLARLVENQLPDMMAGRARPANIEQHLASLIPDQSLILATRGVQLAGLIALDLDHSQVLACFLDPQTASPETPRELFRAAERLALSYGARSLRCGTKPQVSRFMQSLGYAPDPDQSEDGQTLFMSRDLVENARPEVKALFDVLDELGIPADYGTKRRMQLIPEAKTLVSAGQDIFKREQRLTPAAATAWGRMRSAALHRGVDLQLVSGFRAVAYQTNLVRRKLEEGQRLDDLLRVTAPPGYSEHHSGGAIDLTTPGSKPLEEDFAETKAYSWLKANAGIYGFRESYPINNRHRMAWEPWHWRYHHRPGR